ncbi:hypothetical protein [Arthrobacter sp. UYCo732]
MARAYEIQRLASRLAQCTEQVETVMARAWDIQLLTWQSPAGRAYRDSLALQASALGRAHGRITDAQLAVGRHARAVAASAGTAAGRN